MARKRVDTILERHEKLRQEKEPWLPMYQLIGEYVMTRKQNFTTTKTAGEFLTEHLFDNTAGKANHLMSASMVGAHWPNGARTFRIGAPFGLKDTGWETEQVKQFYQWQTKQMIAAMDHPKAGLMLSLQEFMTDQGAFGISGIGAFDNDDLEVPVRFMATDAKQMVIDENNRGLVDVIHITMEKTVRQLIQEYGFENVSKEVKKHWTEGRGNEKIEVVHIIEPRMERDPYKFGSKDMPIASLHIEKRTKKILRESGYEEQPIFVSRFWKALGEKYGRSPAMEGLSDILEINAIREAYTLAHEKNLDPPIAVFDDGSSGASVIDTSAGGVTVFSVSGRLGQNFQKPFEQMITTGELQSTMGRIGELTELIKNTFFIDRLMDLNNETRMTLGEAQIRDNLRGQSLAPVYGRQLAEVFTPLIERVYNIMFRKGLLGVIPGSPEDIALQLAGQTPVYIPEPIIELMMEDKEGYRIDFISPAARAMQTDELRGIQHTSEFALGIAPVKPDILDNLDTDQIIRRVRELTGAPTEIIVSLDTVKKIREQRQQMEAEAMKAQQAREQSETVRNVAQAEQMAKSA